MGGSKSTKIEETEDQKEFARVVAEKWNYSQANLAPLMDIYMKGADEKNTQGAYDYQAGRSNEEAQIIQHDQRMQHDQNLHQAGINPSSGRAAMGLSQLGAAQAEAAGEHSGRSQFEQSNLYVSAQQNIASIGLGQGARAQMGMGDVASIGLERSKADAFNTFNRRQSNLQLAGAVFGAPARAGMEKDGWFSKPAATGQG